MTTAIFIINRIDNVGVALRDLQEGEKIIVCEMEQPLIVAEQIPVSHKIALKDIQRGENIIKYGETVGVSDRIIPRGAWVHTHNLESGKWKAS